jgi:hypothetical protein
MTYRPLGERITDEPAAVTNDRAYWYARGFIAGNPPLGALLLSYLENEIPPGADATGGAAAADLMALMFAEAFTCCPHGDIELAFVEWMTRPLWHGAPIGRNHTSPSQQ